MVSDVSRYAWKFDNTKLRTLYPDISLEFKEDLIGSGSFQREKTPTGHFLRYINDNNESQFQQVGSITLSGGGSGLSTQDSFYFVHYNAVSSNFEIEVYLEHSVNGEFHFMVRESINSDSKYISVSKFSQASLGVRASFRKINGGVSETGTFHICGGSCWLKIHRIDDIFETYYKEDESNDYQRLQGGRQTISMPSSVLIGPGFSGPIDPPPSFTFRDSLYKQGSESVSQIILRQRMLFYAVLSIASLIKYDTVVGLILSNIFFEVFIKYTFSRSKCHPVVGPFGSAIYRSNTKYQSIVESIKYASFST